MGFTEIERNQFIQQALKEQPQSIKELTQYLQSHFTISALCVVPFNLVVLLFLYKQGISLPSNSSSCTIILFVLLSVDILPNMVILLTTQSLI